jgi:dihydrofolate synthase/folylpolyglutamate synthase
MDLEASLKKLFSLHTFGIKLGLENIQSFLNYLGNPQNKLKAFHIAGSNGKGSTAAFTASILEEFRYKVGLYTSPHFIRFNERIVINGAEIPDEYIGSFISDFERYIDEYKLTFFEVTTAMAFKYFQEQNVDYAVIETGLGGRLDATNVFPGGMDSRSPAAVIITSISLEHTNILGKTIELIAEEKSGIIKKHSKVFTGKIPDEALDVIEKKCNETGSQLFPIQEYIVEKENSIELYTEELEFDDWTMPLRGDYQKYNAALATLAVCKVLDTNDFGTIESGIKNVILNTGFQGRFEYYKKNPDIIFDSAHNPEGIANFLSEFRKDVSKYKEKILIFGAMNDKAVKEMLGELRNSFNEIYVTEVNMERSFKIDELLRIASEINLKVKPIGKPIDLIIEFEHQDTSDCLVVLGSMYLLGEIKSLLKERKNP